MTHLGHMGGSGKGTTRRILQAADASDLSPQLTESLAKLGRAMDSTVAAIKRDLAQWLDQREPENSTAINAALIETAFDRFLEERTATASDLAAAAADASDMIQPVLRRCVQRRRAALQLSASKATATAAIRVSDVECAKRVTEMLTLLEVLAGSLPKDAALKQFIDDAAEPLGTLLGYFAEGIVKP